MIALNHSFLRGIAHAEPSNAIHAAALIDHVRRRTQKPARVHETLAAFDTGAGSFIQWANSHKNDSDIGPLVKLVLHMVSGPFLPAARVDGPVSPPLDTLDEWLVDLVRRLFAAGDAGALCGLISPPPHGGADSPRYQRADREVSNWFGSNAFDNDLTASSQGSTLDVLLAAEPQMRGQLIVLPSAKRSAATWTLDCPAAELHRALLGLETYAAALEQLGSDGKRLSRRECAARYHESTTIPMSEESAATWKNPARRRRRMFIAGPYGEQYFDMHAKPGNMTRIHMWTPPIDADISPTPIYLGHCGRHLD
ncbi:MAG: hypothetical protein R3B13_37335 [Polyangiaceae bacterium]